MLFQSVYTGNPENEQHTSKQSDNITMSPYFALWISVLKEKSDAGEKVQERMHFS